MKNNNYTTLFARFIFLPVILLGLLINTSSAQENNIELYGFVMTDVGYQVNQINPDWYDAMRPTKLPAFKDEFAPDGRLFYSVRQTKIGFKSSVNTKYGLFTTKFEFDLFGVGDRVAQTDIRVRHFYGQLGRFGAGQTNSTFMDGDVFPNTMEYWGPSGMLFFRNIQIRYIPIMDKQNELMISLENPGGSGDGGIYADRTELQNVTQTFKVPDFAGHYRYTAKWGYIQVGGIIGRLGWEATVDSLSYLNGDAMRWGGALSSNIKIGKKAILRLMGVYGEGMENYMNDAPLDVALDTTGVATNPFKGVALPVWGATAFLDVNWSPTWSSSFGYSVTTIKNSTAQNPSDFKQGQYFAANLLCYPVNNVMIGAEFLFGRRDNYKDGFHSVNPQVRLGFRYNFGHVWTWK